jgi:hypothetical protein
MARLARVGLPDHPYRVIQRGNARVRGIMAQTPKLFVAFAP